VLVIRATTKMLDRVGGVCATNGHPSSTSRHALVASTTD
jgi:hypothetical protein